MSSNFMISVSVKQEPVSELRISSEDDTPTESLQFKIMTPEFINIKNEHSTEFSIKEEPTSEPSPPDPTSNHPWHLVKTELEDDVQDANPESEMVINQINVNTELIKIKMEPGYLDLGSTVIEPQTSSQYAYIDNEDYMQQHLSKQSTTCPICQKHFANIHNVKRHISLHARAKFECTNCSKQFLNEARLKKHVCTCQECGKKFSCSSKLKQHSLVHLTEKPYSCNICRRTFATELYLVKHQSKSRCKRPIDEPLSCNICLKEFDKVFLLKSHLRKHDTDRPFICDLCGMNFKYKSAIVRHLQWHNGVKPYSCKYCNKTFVHSGLMKPHLRTHTGEKPYQCTVCEKRFSHKHNMQRHTARHCKIKKLVCEICHKKFPRESRLIYHMRTHLNVKGFSCPICHREFSHRQNILRHYARKHPGHTYDCPDTDAKFAIKIWDKMKHFITGEPEEILG